MIKKELLTVKEASLFALAEIGQKISESTFNSWRHKRVGPRWVVVGSRVYYRREDLAEFLKGQVRETLDSAAGR